MPVAERELDRLTTEYFVGQRAGEGADAALGAAHLGEHGTVDDRGIPGDRIRCSQGQGAHTMARQITRPTVRMILP